MNESLPPSHASTRWNGRGTELPVKRRPERMCFAWVDASGFTLEELASIQPGYDRWFSPLWEPPSPEIESLLFGLQAAIGAGAVAYCLGYYRGRRRRKADDAARD